MSPKFNKPPVIETVLAIQCDELPDFRGVHFGQYFETVRSEFPDPEDHPRLPPILESFPGRAPLPSFELSMSAQPQRLWCKDNRQGRLIQVQPDRFALNWRRFPTEMSYPGFKNNLDQFCSQLDRLARFAAEAGLGSIRQNVGEVTYVNEIAPVAGQSIADRFSSVFSGIEWKHSDDWLPKPELVSLSRTFVIPEQRGRLYAEASVKFRPRTNDPVILLVMTARVLRRHDTTAAEDLQIAHDWVVNGFVSLTNPRIRAEEWEQQS
jgi:uncharacterized protein (TIGR04255 family)